MINLVEFNELVRKCIENNQYVGLGNPEANILFIGKEAGFDFNDADKNIDYRSNAKVWDSGNIIYSKPFIPTEKNLRNGNHTWQKYQKLFNKISGSASSSDYRIDFVANAFTTELSNLPYPNTTKAKEEIDFRERLAERKRIFFQSNFIRNFPITIIAALDKNYISNHGEGESREIDKIFEVAFDKQVSCKSSKDKFWVHYNTTKGTPKILIHTRQFTNGASNELLELIGEEIKWFAAEHSIEIIQTAKNDTKE